MTARVKRGSRVTVSVDVEAVETDPVGGRTIGSDKVRLPLLVGRVRKLQHVEETLYRTVPLVEQHFWVFSREI
jgi:hypothetical protein